MPYTDAERSNQYVPSAAVAVGTEADPNKSVVLQFTLNMYALLAKPKNEYAACNPYSFNSYPWIGVPADDE
jgi:hypothetical protein